VVIEFLLDPAFFALGGTVFGGAGLKTAEHFLKRGRTPKAIEEKVDPSFACKVWETRHLEEKLVEGGVVKLSDMTICEDKACTNCMPTRTARYNEDRAIAAAEQAKIEQWQHNENKRGSIDFETVSIGGQRFMRVRPAPEVMSHRRRKLMKGDYEGYSDESLVGLGFTPDDIEKYHKMMDYHYRQMTREPSRRYNEGYY
jgi:hypothetical protein